MKKDLQSHMEFVDAIKNNELVYIFGTGISSALTGERYSWWKWICDGIEGLKDVEKAKELKYRLSQDESTDNMIQVVGDLLTEAKSENTYNTWMQAAFENNQLKNTQLAETLRSSIRACH